MDVQVVAIGAVVFVISAVLIYLISAFTMKEKTFEEVMAEQRRQEEAEKEKLKLEKKHEKEGRKKFKKKEKGKEKSPQVSPRPERSGSGSGSDHEGKERKMVEYELEPEIIEPLEVKPLKASKKKEKPAKSILHNKDEKTPVVPDTLVQQIIHTVQTPKDDLELKHAHEKDHKVKKEKPAKHESETKAKQVVVEEMVVRKETHVHSAAPPSVESRSYKQQDIAEKDNSGLIASVKSTSFSDSDLQSLIDILLSKQGAAGYASDWNKKAAKGDPVTLLKKQLEEKERSLQEAQQMAMSADTKLKEMRHDLNQEKMRYMTLEKGYSSKVEEQKLEVQALQQRMQHTHEQHMMESNQMRTRIQQLEAQAGDQSRVQRVAEENQMLRDTLAKTQAEAISPAEMNSLKQKVSIMEKELSSNALKLNTSENLKRSLEQKVAKYEKEQKDKENTQKTNTVVVEKRLEEVTQELRKSEGKAAALQTDLQSANSSLDVAHKECVTLKVKLQELERSLIGHDQAAREKDEKLKEADRTRLDMEGNLKNLQKKVEDYDRDQIQLNTQIQTLKQQNQALSDEMRATREKQQKEIEELSKTKQGAQNGDIHAEEEIKLQAAITEKDHDLSEKVAEICKLKSEVEGKKTELSTLQRELDIQKKKNNELREKNWKAMDALDKAEKSVSEKVKSALKTNVDEQSASQSELEANDKAVLQRLFPDITVKDIKVHKDWMSKFEKEASSHLQTLSKPQPDSSAKYEKNIHDLETKISDLEKQLKAEDDSKKDSENLQVTISDLEKKLNNANKELESLRSASKDSAGTTSKVSDLERELSQSKGKQESLQSEVTDLERQLGESEKGRETLQSQVQEYDSSYTKLQSQVAQYRSVLAETENKLTQLESSVESEEKKWQDKLSSREQELEQTKTELHQLREELLKSKGSQEELNDLNFAYRCVEKSLTSIIDEMKEKVELLEQQLQSSEDKCSQLETQLKEAEGKVSEYKVQIEETKNMTVTIKTISDDLEELKRQLEAEKKKNKDLASNVVKLNGIIKTGHDALTQEQNLVEQLRKQLSSGSHANSVAPNDVGTEIKELKGKLEEKEKHLEQEISANKLLKQRLASSQSSLNEAGTSV